MNKDYEMVIGLEVHCELKTKTKIFCGCSTEFGAEPNTHCCPVCMGMPGSLPVLNQKVVEYAVKAGLATHCTIARFSKQDRKNYFYPDMPKAYQISQYDLPLCVGGHLDIETSEGTKRIGITRIHIEEDAGKLVHTEDGGTLCDYNRCGVPLIEIVSEPDIRSPEEARAYVEKLRAILLYTGVSDCKMQEGSLRCDVNLSVRKKGDPKLGTRTEMKNLNSLQFMCKAIAYEFDRQIEVLESGGKVVQETRRYDQSSGKTFTMRTKEDADDYRYFPEPDLIPIVMSAEEIERLQKEIPELPDERKKVYIEKYGISSADAEIISNRKGIADYFEEAVKDSQYPKQIANLLISEFLKLLPPETDVIPVSPEHLKKLAVLLQTERINSGTGKKLAKQMWENDTDPEIIAEDQGLWQISSKEELIPIIEKVMCENPKSVQDYRKGKTQAIQMLVGQTIRKTDGKGNPKIIMDVLQELLK